ncbi:MAG TPA: divalent-cation tolerance protein CutA [bacterium]|nr:divalent-cation tolerance protein CutA [bacterium]
MKYHVVLVTSPNRSVSEKLSKGLVNQKLAACVNRVPGVTSRYWWRGKIETSREELLIIKTVKRKLPVLTQWIKANHPYQVCEVLALPVIGGNPDYLNWIDQSFNSRQK